MNNQCSADVHRDWHTYSCSKKANIVIDGKSYCGTHNPINVKKRDDKMSKDFDKEVLDNAYKRYSLDYCKKKGLSLEELKKFVKQGKSA